MVVKLKEGVYWVGVIDWAIRNFHGHELSTHRGSTYNAYLIVDKKIVLVDTVWGPFAERAHREYPRDRRPGEDRLSSSRTTPRPITRARCPPSCGMRRTPTVVVSKNGARERAGAFPRALEFQAGEHRRQDQHRHERSRLRRGADAPLAGQHVHLPDRAQHPHAERRLRPALRHRRSASTTRWTRRSSTRKRSSTTPTSSPPSATA